jgi:hypothetical protein
MRCRAIRRRSSSCSSLRGTEPPPPRDFSVEQINSWIADDKAGMRRLRTSGAAGELGG